MTTLQIIEVVLVVTSYAVSLALLPRVVLSRRDSAATLSWILVLVFLPLIGLILFWAFGERRLKRFVGKRRSAILQIDRVIGTERGRRAKQPEDVFPKADRDIIDITTKLCDSPPFAGNQILQFSDPDAATERMLASIDAARDHVHFEVYQFKSDESGRVFREKLISAAKRGVKVRLLIDDVGSLWTPKSFFNPIREAGGEVATFLPVNPLRGLYHANLRNHRKILIIDGKVAYTGGLNVGDEYGGPRKRRFGPWRDTHSELRGPAVAAMQDVFLEDWFFITNHEIELNSAFPKLQNEGDVTVHIVPSGPDADWEVIHHAIFTTITKAADHIYLTTPYFVPDRALLVALQTAALRGVDVRLLLPARSDHVLVRAAGHFHYQELLRAGVRIFEYTQGMLHAKTVEVDGRWATIGSANLDLRSFRLNFEINIVIYGAPAAQELKTTFLSDLKHSVEVKESDVKKWTFGKRLAIASARLMEGIL